MHTPLLRHPWALDRPTLELLAHSPTPPLTATSTASMRAPTHQRGRTTVIGVRGVLDQHDSAWLQWYGGTSTDGLTRALRLAVADPAVDTIVLDIDSPGGSVFGTPEFAAEVFAARRQTRLIAVANSVAASAAYWIGSAASEFYVTPSGEVGSIGCYMVHLDVSQALAQAGVSVTVIRAGTYKAEGNPYEPLSAEARDYQQAGVDRYHTMFIAAVAQHRGVSVPTVRQHFGEGRMVGAHEALRLGMVDGIATRDDVLRGHVHVTRQMLDAQDLELRRRRLAIAAAAVH